MTSAQIRQSFLQFFREKQHTIVGSSSLLPDSPNLLFTNAGMNQFVPIFLGQRECPHQPPRVADTQKCIRAGGKHNDLEDVGLDTYHHTFFEMLGNWSFGDYFKKEAIEWAWELVVGRWQFPANRLYATVYSPDQAQGDPSEFDGEAWNFWAKQFEAAGLDPAVHIVAGNKKDNFWMMGDTGPCGPCSELHVDLTAEARNAETQLRGSKLVNTSDARCIEIWNLVFIQFNAQPVAGGEGIEFVPLAARHVDTGMGFERVASIMQGTKNFSAFAEGKISNYETDVFRPIFDEIERLSGQKYGSTLPVAGSAGASEQERIDIAFRVIADHIRTLAFAVADGIQPGNTDRNYVLRRILRRAVRYGRTLGFHDPFFFKLVDVVARTMGDVFPEVRMRQEQVQSVLRAEEEAFNKTLDRGIALFETESARLTGISGEFAFTLYDTYGFPLDLTELMARERGLTVDVAGFEKLMAQQRARARAAQKKQIIELSQIETDTPTRFVGYEKLSTKATVQEVVGLKEKTAVVLDISPAYAEMGGQVGDTGEIATADCSWRITNTQKSGDVWLHLIDTDTRQRRDQSSFVGSLEAIAPAATVTVSVDPPRRRAIERHHSVTHLLHWALHEVVSRDATQKGSFVGADKLTFDFNSAALTTQQVRDVERLVNERIVENAPITWTEVPFAEVKARADIMQFFGDKYGDRVRVVQIGGKPDQLDGYSMELCAGTHTRATGEIGLFRIVGEAAIAAGVRRIEAVAGLNAYELAHADAERLKQLAGRVGAPLAEFDKRIETMLVQQKELEKQLDGFRRKQAAHLASSLMGKIQTLRVAPAILEPIPGATGDELQAIADALRGQFKGVVVLAGSTPGQVALIATVSPEFVTQCSAGKLIQAIAPIVGGKGGGRPEAAQGAGKEPAKVTEALAHVRELLA
jgi:alanyl-tRNA synthetase